MLPQKTKKQDVFFTFTWSIFQGWNKNYPFNNGDITVSAMVLANYLGMSSCPFLLQKWLVSFLVVFRSEGSQAD